MGFAKRQRAENLPIVNPSFAVLKNSISFIWRKGGGGGGGEKRELYAYV